MLASAGAASEARTAGLSVCGAGVLAESPHPVMALMITAMVMRMMVLRTAAPW